MADTRNLRRFYGQVEQANRALSAQWQHVSNHLGNGLLFPVGTSALLRRVYRTPDHYPGPDGRRHRKPMRALYGFGESAKQRFESDLATFNRYCAGLIDQVNRDNAALDYWVARSKTGDPQAISWYCTTVLPFVLVQIPGVRPYLRTAYSVEERRHLVLDRWTPGIEVIPDAQRYEVRGGRYSTHSSAVPTSNKAAWYLQFLAQVALLTADRLFRSEISAAVDVLAVNCLTVLRNPASGFDEFIPLLSVRVAKESLSRINLSGVNPVDCILQLGARVTRMPGEFAPVIPLATTQQGAVTVTVTDAPLLEMDPSAFELLVTELLRRMGLRASNTGRTGDGGIDCEAYDDRPVVGGKVIVQVKRYSNIVPPSVVRDLFGTVHASGATKGVLVTTSGFGPESRQFVQGKPLELIDGVQLDALLKQYKLGRADGSATSNSLEPIVGTVPPVTPTNP